MKKMILSLVMGLVLASSFSYAELKLVPAKELNEISKKTTAEVISKFMNEKKTKNAYVVIKAFIAKELNDLAKEGFYNVKYIWISDYDKKHNYEKVYSKLTKKEKDILESILKKELKSLGYSVVSGKYDSVSLNWGISFGGEDEHLKH